METEVLEADGITCLAFTFDRTLDSAQVQTMARVVERAIATAHDIRLLLDLRRTERIKLGAFLSPQSFLASVRSIGPVSRYAVVGAPPIASAAVEAFGTILPLESRAYSAGNIAEARCWVAEQSA